MYKICALYRVVHNAESRELQHLHAGRQEVLPVPEGRLPKRQVRGRRELPVRRLRDEHGVGLGRHGRQHRHHNDEVEPRPRRGDESAVAGADKDGDEPYGCEPVQGVPPVYKGRITGNGHYAV